MQHPAVHWANGIFLRPHHFQAADRHWNELSKLQQQFDHPIGYGIQSINIATESLRGGVFEFRALRARLPQGPVVAGEDGDLQRLEIPLDAEPLARGVGITVYLAIPKVRDGHANVATGSNVVDARYLEHVGETADESAGGDRQSLRFRDYQVRYLLSTDDLNGYDTLPIARLRRGATAEEALVLDPEYYPPCLSIQSWQELAAIMRRILDDVMGRVRTLGTQIREKRISFSSQTQGDLQKMMLLHALNEAAGELTCLTQAPGVHPLTAFTALCQIIGRLSIFGADLIPPEFPPYDHDDLAPLFIWARKTIRQYILSIQDDEFHQRFFIGAGTGMRVQLEAEWFAPEWNWYFGVHPINATREETLHLLRHQLDWVLGCASDVERLFSVKAPGVSMKRLKQVPSFLPSASDWMFFEIMVDNDAWRKVHLEQSLAMRVKREQIANLDQLQGQSRMRLIVEGKTVGIEFAIFAARSRM